MPSNKFYCGAILFFAGILLSTLITIVVFMVAPPSNRNTTVAEVRMAEISKGTSAAPTHNRGKPLLSSSPSTPSPMSLLSTPPTAPVPAARTGLTVRNIRSSLQTTVSSVPNAQTHLSWQITTRTSPITTRTSPITTRIRTSPITTCTTRTSPITTRKSPITTETSPITTQTSPITTRTSPITTRTSPITTRSSPSLTVEPIPRCPKNHTTRVFAGTGTVSSPGYPDEYPPDMCRTWIFWTSPGRKVVLKFLHFVVEEYYSCKWDNVTIVVDGKRPGQTYCGGGKNAYHPRPPPSTITGDTTVEVTMRADGNHEESGIKLQYGNIPVRFSRYPP